MQAVFGEHKSTKLFHELFAFDESLTSTNSISNRYFYPVCPRGLSIIPNPDYKIQVNPAKAGLNCPLWNLKLGSNLNYWLTRRLQIAIF
jgi:uncharacterized membrane protein YvbJ